MKLNCKYTLLTLSTALWVVLSTSCFTGVESTPRITANDVRRDAPAITAEETYLNGITPEPFCKWKPGKKFHVADNRISLMFGAQGNSLPPLSNRQLTYMGAQSATAVDGNKVTDISFLTPEGTEVKYRVPQSISSLQADSTAIEIPFLVDIDMVDDVKRIMLGNDYYITTSSWYDLNSDSRRGRKFVKVHIDSVSPGNDTNPILLTLHEEGTTDNFRISMSIGNGLRSTRKFHDLFSLSDPRDKHTDITDETWRLIQNCRVTAGMTRNECRLSLGKPDEISRRTFYNAIIERWAYNNGIYLIFEDGLLTTYRN